MRAHALVWLFFMALAAALLAQEPQTEPSQEQPTEEEGLWMPEGYRLLSFEERKALSKDEMNAVGKQNMELLQETIEAMTPAERQETIQRIARFSQTHQLKDHERQYVTLVQMRLLAQPQAKEYRKLQEERRGRIEQLVRDQEATTRGFPGDAEAVQNEAQAIRALVGKEDATALYLRVLRPLRARPWNHDTRIALEKIVRGRDDLIEALLQFCAARQKEKPEEGAWFSLEAFVRLSMRDDEEAGRRLFAVAVQKNARDLDSRIFPLLLAEIDGDQAAVSRLRPRALEAWPKPEELDQTLFDWIEALPLRLQAKAHDTFQAKYGKTHPTNWEARLRRIWEALEDNPYDVKRRERVPQIEREAASVLVLPVTLLPQPYRMEFLAVALVTRARLGRCDEVEAEMPGLDRAIDAAAPLLTDWNDPPPPRTVEDVAEIRRSASEMDALAAKLERYRKAGDLRDLPELRDVPPAERQAAVEKASVELNRIRGEARELLASESSGDTAVAAAWTRREREEWEKERHVDTFANYDIPTSAELYRIRVRSALGKCLLERSDLDRAIRVLKPCFGDRRNVHRACVEPLVDKGIALAIAGKVPAATSIFRLLQPVTGDDGRLDQLRQAIEHAAPGSLPSPNPSARPTPIRPVA